MNSSERVLINTLVQYVKTIVCLLLTLYSTRLILSALGVEDYGIYSLIGGVISLMSFLVNALVISTQRFLSYNSGLGSLYKQKIIFSNSLCIHLFISVIVIFILESIDVILLNNFLEIPRDKFDAALSVYHIVVIMIVLSFISSPFRALLISKENIIYISIVDIIDSVLKLVIAIYLNYLQYDKLVIYALLLCSINVFNFLAFAMYDFAKYDECVIPRHKYLNWPSLKEMITFAVWSSFNVICITGRTQGISIIINKFFTLAVNAAYGLALQINSALAFISQSVRNALNPQIMRAEGTGDREKMIYLATLESKVCFLFMGIVLIPCIFEMDTLISLWLNKVPQYAVIFVNTLIIMNIVDQFTIGLEAANQAYGKIKSYSIVINTLKISTLIAILVGLSLNCHICVIIYCLIAFELICAIMRLFIMNIQINIPILTYCKNVVLKSLIPLVASIIVCLVMTTYIRLKYRFILTILLGVTIGILLGYKYSFEYHEKCKINNILRNIYKRMINYMR